VDRDQLRDMLLTQIPPGYIDQAMRWVDDYVANLTEEPPEAWTAEQVALFIGAKSTAAVRSTMSRWGIKSIAFQDHPLSGRQQALYPAEQVRDTYYTRNQKEVMEW